MNIREAVIEDSPGLARVRLEGWESAYRGLMPDAVLDGMDLAKEEMRWRGMLAASTPASRLSVAEIDGQVAGFCGVGACRDADLGYDGELYAIYVLPAMQHRGVGQALARAGMDWLRAHGFHKMLIWVLRDNLPARRFYEQIGGAPVHERLIEIGGADLPELGYGVDL